MCSKLKYPEDLKEKISQGETSSSFSESLTSLNTTVLVWIKQEVDENPTVILLPIFKFYEEKLKDLQDKCPSLLDEQITETIGQEEYQTIKCEVKEETLSSQHDSIQGCSFTLGSSEPFTLQETQIKCESNENTTSQLEISEPPTFTEQKPQLNVIVSSCKTVSTPTDEGK